MRTGGLHIKAFDELTPGELYEGIAYATSHMGAERLYLEAQVYAIGFYEKEGFKVFNIKEQI